MNDEVWREGYSRHEGLRAFLRTLSYLEQGPEWFAEQILRNAPRAGWCLLDIGCGEGSFTSRLLRRLEDQGLIPTRIHAVDPDAENLAAYHRHVSSVYRGEIHLVEGRVESLEGHDIPPADVIIMSHALYGFLELPTTTRADMNHVLGRLIAAGKPGGILLWSLASETSAAYDAKRDLLRALSLPDRSVFGQSVARTFDHTGTVQMSRVVASYIDVTDLFGKDPEAILEWTSYFCRVPVDRLRAFGSCQLLGIIEAHARSPDRFDETPSAVFAESGVPTVNATHVLPHAEVMGYVDLQ